MPFQGDINNPIPSNVDKTKENPYFTNTKNTAFDVRRDTDQKKNFTITLLDIDTTIIEYLQNVINPSVNDVGNNVNVPIIYGSPERWKAAQNDGYLRDQQGKLQLPAIMFKRNSFSKDDTFQTFNRYLTYPVIAKFTEKNKYDKFSLLNETVAPVNQIFAVTLPDHIKVEYEFLIWTEYVEQMNRILEKINFAEGDYWGDKQRFKFRVNINDYSHTTEVSADKDRMVRTSFSLNVFAYLLPESYEDRKSTVQKILTPRKVSITSEMVEDNSIMEAVKNDINDQSYNNPSNLYYRAGNVMSANQDSWTVPKPSIVTEKSTVAGGVVLEKIRQSFSLLIQQTTVNINGNFNIWHDPPIGPNSPGQEGWMAYDGDYHYIYVNGRWRRQAIDDYQ
jgi:hypothetical protein